MSEMEPNNASEVERPKRINDARLALLEMRPFMALPPDVESVCHELRIARAALSSTPAATVKDASGGEAWIDVNERLPDHRNDVLVAYYETTDDGMQVDTAYYGVTDSWFWHSGTLAQGVSISHWQPFPAPPVSKAKALGAAGEGKNT